MRATIPERCRRCARHLSYDGGVRSTRILQKPLPRLRRTPSKSNGPPRLQNELRGGMKTVLNTKARRTRRLGFLCSLRVLRAFVFNVIEFKHKSLGHSASSMCSGIRGNRRLDIFFRQFFCGVHHGYALQRLQCRIADNHIEQQVSPLDFGAGSGSPIAKH